MALPPTRLTALGLGAVACAWSLCARAQTDWTSEAQSYLCKSSTEVREIRTYWREAAPAGQADAATCRVDYLKSGGTQTLWTARHDRAYCDGKAAALVAKLTASGTFHCQRLQMGVPAPP